MCLGTKGYRRPLLRVHDRGQRGGARHCGEKRRRGYDRRRRLHPVSVGRTCCVSLSVAMMLKKGSLSGYSNPCLTHRPVVNRPVDAVVYRLAVGAILFPLITMLHTTESRPCVETMFCIRAMWSLCSISVSLGPPIPVMCFRWCTTPPPHARVDRPRQDSISGERGIFPSDGPAPLPKPSTLFCI